MLIPEVEYLALFAFFRLKIQEYYKYSKQVCELPPTATLWINSAFSPVFLTKSV